MKRASLLALATASTLAWAVPASAGFVYPAPKTYSEVKDVTYATIGGTPLKLHLFEPQTKGPHPVVIYSFLATGDTKLTFGEGGYAGWAKLAASRGIVAVLADLRPDTRREETSALIDYLIANADRYGIDPKRIVLHGASMNANPVMAFVQDPKETRVASAVIYYGGWDAVPDYKRDLPVMVVRAGRDRLVMNEWLDEGIASAQSHLAPWTIATHPSGLHGFDIFNDDDVSRMLIDQTMDFILTSTKPGYRAALREGLTAATAASYLMAKDYAKAVPVLREIHLRDPADPANSLSYGEALLGDKQFAAACDHFESLREARLGPRDRGVPAARACIQANRTDRALYWLTSIPAQYFPKDLLKEQIFSSVRGRPELADRQ